MKHNFPSNPEHQKKRGTVLLTVTIIVFMIAAATAVTMKLALSDLRQNRQERKEMQSRKVAESAAQIGLSRLNNELLEEHTLGELGKSSAMTITDESADATFGALSVPSGDMAGNPADDGFDNDGDGQVDEPDEANQTYTDGKYRIRLTEWSHDNGEDDDNDGDIDELDEKWKQVSSNSPNFSINGDSIKPKNPFKVKLTVLAAIPDTPDPPEGKIITNPNNDEDPGQYHAPVTAKLIIGDDVITPWGPFDDPIGGNIHTHGGENWPTYTYTSKLYEEGVNVSLHARSWYRTGETKEGEDGNVYDYQTLRKETTDTNPDEDGENKDNTNMEPVKDGDEVPAYEGANDQADAAEFISKEYINDDGEIDTSGPIAMYLSELTHEAEKKDGEYVDKEGVDFQDLVVEMEFITFPNYEGGSEDKLKATSVMHKRRFTMDVTGTYGGHTTTLGNVVTATPKTKAKYGVFATNDLTLKKGVVVDSYNSNQGHYNDQKTHDVPTGVGSKYARTNGNAGANKAIGLHSDVAVMGRVDFGVDVFDPPSTHIHNSSNSGSLEEKQNFENKEFPAVDGLLPKSSISFSGEENTIGPEDDNDQSAFKFSNVTLEKKATLHVRPETFLWITDSFEAKQKSKLIVEGPATIRVDQDFVTDPKFTFEAATNGKPIEVYVGGELKLGPQSMVYTTRSKDGSITSHTQNLQWFIGDKNNPGINSVTIESDMKNPKISKAPFFQGILYAPTAPVEIKPNTQVQGTVIGKNVNVHPGAGIHYDEALDKFCVKLWNNCEYRASIDSTWVKSRGTETTSE